MSRIILPEPQDPFEYAAAQDPPLLILFEPLQTRTGVYMRSSRGERLIVLRAGMSEKKTRIGAWHEISHDETTGNSVAIRFGSSQTIGMLGASGWSPDHDRRFIYFECGDEDDEDDEAIIDAESEEYGHDSHERVSALMSSDEARADRWCRERLFPASLMEALRKEREEDGLGFGDGGDWEWLSDKLLIPARTLRRWGQVYQATDKVRGSNWAPAVSRGMNSWDS